MTRTLFFLSLLIISCSKDPITPEAQVDPIPEEPTIVQNELVLTNIAYNSQLVNNTWNQTFIYDDSSMITEVKDSNHGFNYEIEYENALPVSISELYNGDLGKKDLINYNTDGKIESIVLSIPQANGDLEERWIYNYTYDGNERVASKSSTFLGNLINIEKYIWSGNKITKLEVYDADNNLSHEYDYAYDDKKNYKKDNPFFLENPLNWQENNITHTSVTDHTGLLDLVCYECPLTYAYNEDDYPTTITTGWGQELVLTYE